jgi:hypothetical protein
MITRVRLCTVRVQKYQKIKTRWIFILKDSDTLVKSWHMKHMISHRTHYSFFSRRLNNICQMQKDPFYPVFHFPTIISEQVTVRKEFLILLEKPCTYVTSNIL